MSQDPELEQGGSVRSWGAWCRTLGDPRGCPAPSGLVEGVKARKPPAPGSGGSFLLLGDSIGHPAVPLDRSPLYYKIYHHFQMKY